MTLSGMRFLAVRTTAPRTATLRELYGASPPSRWYRPTATCWSAPGATRRSGQVTR